ncbi:MAG: urease subunit beta [Nitrospira sp.]
MPKKTKRSSAKRQQSPRKTMRSLAAVIKAELGKPVVPGEILVAAGEVEAFNGRETRELTVKNVADRPIQVGSHCHFFESNHALTFDRAQAFGFRLCIPAGTAVRFEPGEDKRVTVVALAGKRVAYGINGLTEGSLDDAQVKGRALSLAGTRGFSGKGGVR